MPDSLVFIDNPHTVTFAVDRETRTIRGRALPFGEVGNGWSFSAGTLNWAEKVKGLDGHDWASAFATTTLAEEDGGIDFVMKVARGARGDQMLTLAEDGVYDGASIGLAAGAGYEIDDAGIFHCTSGTIREVSLTPIPAFENAKVTSVAASAAPTTKETDKMPEDVKVFTADEGTALAAQVATLEAQLKELGEIKAPVGHQQFQVTEEPMYRFAGSEPAPSGHDFARDLLAAAKDNDAAALERIKTFTAQAADEPRNFVTTANTAQVNPAQYRPDMFLGQAPVPTSPLYDTFHKGGLDDITPFFYSKLERTATTVAVGDHTEGNDPALTNLVTAVGATVTPTPVSGRVHITREVGDQGGNPSVSGLVWAEFERSFGIALENKTAALVQAQMANITALTAAAIAAGATGQVAGDAVERGLVGLQFIADGTRFTRAFGHIDLYAALTAAVLPATGEKVYPIINPQNRNGITGDKYSFIEVGGYRFNPAWSLGATSANASNSLVADPVAVHVWNSGLQRLEKLQEKVEGWDIGCFGYFAGIVYDVTGLRKISYDPVA